MVDDLELEEWQADECLFLVSIFLLRKAYQFRSSFVPVGIDADLLSMKISIIIKRIGDGRSETVSEGPEFLRSQITNAESC